MNEFQNALIALQFILGSAGIFVGAAVRRRCHIPNGLLAGNASGQDRLALRVAENLTSVGNAVDAPEAEIRNEEERFVLPDGSAQVGIEIIEVRSEEHT